MTRLPFCPRPCRLRPPSAFTLWLLVVMALLTLGTLAEEISPTETFIRVQSLKFHARARARVTRAVATRRGRFIRSRVTVMAATEPEAHRAGRREAYAHAADLALASRADLRGLSRRLAANTAELRDVKETLLHEQKTPEGYTVDVEIERPEAQILADVRSEALSNYRLVALLPETVDGERVTEPTVETAVVGRLADAGYTVYDWNVMTHHQPATGLVQVALTNNDAANTVGIRYLANTVIAGTVRASFSQDNDGIISYHADANFRVIRVDTGQIIMADELSEKGFGQDRRQAARNALKALAATMSVQVPDRLRERQDGVHSVTVEAQDQTAEALTQMKSFLEGQRGVTMVEEIKTPAGTVFRLRSEEKPAVLMSSIENSADYEVLAVHRRP